MSFVDFTDQFCQRVGPIVVLGRAGMDLYPLADGTKIAAATHFASDMGGSAGNIAAALARQNTPTALLSCVSADPVGDFVMAKLAALGIGADLMRRSTGLARTSLALAESRSTDCEVVIYRNDAADLQLVPTQMDALTNGAYKALVITGTALSANPSRDLILQNCAKLAAQNFPIILDIDYRITAWPNKQEAAATYRQLLPYLSLLVGNEEEFDVLAQDGSDQTEPDQDGLTLARKLACGGLPILYKRGGAGCVMLDGDQQHNVGIYPVEPLKPFGAGDAFLGNFLASLSRGDKPVYAVQTGAAAAALIVTKRGCADAMPDQPTLQTFMASHNYQPIQ